MLIETKMINYAVPHLVEIKVVFHDCKKAFVPLYLFLHFLRVRFLSCNILLLTKSKSHKYLKPILISVSAHFS